LGNDQIHNKFDEIDKKVDMMLERFRSLQIENQELTRKIQQLESDLEERIQTEARISEQETVIQSKVDGLLSKLNSFTRSEET
jgi:peptidoglycan hydrolase CwlO-like protein